MALESKAVFLKEVERQLSSTLCLNDMRSTMHVLADTLAQFTMETQRPEAELPDDLLDAYISALSVEGRSPKTLERYRYIISRMRKAVNVHPHKFRRTTATNLIRHGMGIQEVAALLGHDKLDTTMAYVVLNNSEIKTSYLKYA